MKIKSKIASLGEEIIDIRSEFSDVVDDDLTNIVNFFDRSIKFLFRKSLCKDKHLFVCSSKKSYKFNMNSNDEIYNLAKNCLNIEDIALREISLYLEGKIWYDFQNVRETLSTEYISDISDERGFVFNTIGGKKLSSLYSNIWFWTISPRVTNSTNKFSFDFLKTDYGFKEYIYGPEILMSRSNAILYSIFEYDIALDSVIKCKDEFIFV